MRNKIDWHKGSASLLLCAFLSMAILAAIIIYLLMFSFGYAQSIAVTRCDAIADSTAVYAQSYDYKYNKSQADLMTSLLTTYNNTTSKYYSLSSSLTFPKDDILKVNVVVKTPAFFSTKYVYSPWSTQVKSVDIWGDILVVPDSIGKDNHQTPDTPPNANDADGSV